MLVNGERERERWGVEHDTPHAQNNVGHDAWNNHSNSDNYEYEGYEGEYDYDEYEGYEGEYDYEYNYDSVGAGEELTTYVYDNPSVHRQGEPASEPVAEYQGPISFPLSSSNVGYPTGEPSNTDCPVSFPLSIHNSGKPDSRSAEARPPLDCNHAEIPISFPLSRSGGRAGKMGRENDRDDDINTNLVVGLQEGKSEVDDDILPHPPRRSQLFAGI